MIYPQAAARSAVSYYITNLKGSGMQKKISLGVFVVSLLLCVLLTAMTTFVIARDGFLKDYRTADHSGSDMLSKLAELDRKFSSVYVGEADYETAEKYVMLSYLAGTGDKYAYYYTAEEYKEMMDSSSGNSQGIGVSVIFNTEYSLIEVISVMPDSPALKAGMEKGDLIAYIGIGEDRESVAELGYDAALTKLRGSAGTMAEFTVLRGHALSTEVEFSIERGYFSDSTVYSHLYGPDNSVGIVKISSFERITPKQFVSAVDELTSAGAKSLIVDLRDNPGGDRQAICDVLDYILPEGPLLRVLEAEGKTTVINESDADCIDIPIAVVVNSNTASAAELFTAAMRDYDRARIVGETTFGKGSMQTFYPLADGSYFKATVSYYCPPFSDNYDGVGIVPDVEVALDESLKGKNVYKITDEEDNQLAAAYQQLK